MLFDTSPTDAATFAGVASVLVVVALIAGAIPDIRAVRIDPVAALRADPWVKARQDQLEADVRRIWT